MAKVVFSGCSFTAGNGWIDTDLEKSLQTECKESPDLWVNLCHNQIDRLKTLDLVNIGQGGASNLEIFKNTVKVIGQYNNNIDTIFCQWTSVPRYNFSVGFESWPTTEGLQQSVRSTEDVNLNKNISWDRAYLDDLLDRLLVLHHLHGEIVKVVEYCNILQSLVNLFDIKIYFINGLCPWDQDYFVRLTEVLPEQFTPFTKKEILNIDSRDDNDIFKLYTQLHDEYQLAGGIDPTKWINLYSSMSSNKVDTNFDQLHPGTKSNQIYFQQIKTFLENQ